MNNNGIWHFETFFEGFSCSFSDFIYRFFSNNVALLGDRGSSDGLISSNHDNFNTSWSTFQDSIRNSISWWISEWENTDETLLLKFKVFLFKIELEIFWIFVFWKMILSETQNSLTISTKLGIGFFKFLIPFSCFRNWLSTDINMST